MDLPKALGEASGRSVRDDDLIVLQEVPRQETGWQSQTFDSLKVVSHREENQWRGVGVGFSEKSWTAMRKVSSENGVWVRLRHLSMGQELWLGSLYVKPDCNQAEHERRVQQHLDCLPATHLPVALGCDLNSPLTWVQQKDKGAQAAAGSGKSNQFLTQLGSRGIGVIPPSCEQLQVPTSRPRQQDRNGRIIDFISGARLVAKECVVHVGSHSVLGTDHELLTTDLVFSGLRNRRRPNTKPRQLVKEIGTVLEVDQQILRKMAAEHTEARGRGGYQDPADVKALFRMARFSRLADDWKAAFGARRTARKAHRESQVEAVAAGDRSAFRQLKTPREQRVGVPLCRALQ